MNPSERSTTGEPPSGSAGEIRLTEARNPRTRHIDRADPREIVDLIQAEDRAVPAAVEAEAPVIARLIEEVTGRIRRGGRLVYVGAGTSGRLGILDAAECPPTFGTDPDLVQGVIAGGREALVRSREGVEDDPEAGRIAMRRLEIASDDFVLGIASSGTTPYVAGALGEATGRGAGTGLLGCTPPPEAVRGSVDFSVTPLVGPEVIAGSTRMKAGTATKLVLNTLTTGVMIRLGKVYENLMVDLRAASRKLVERSLRIVTDVTGADREEARRLLLAAGGSARIAIAMRELGTSRAMAERVLDASDGLLRNALERFGGMETIPYYACYSDDFSDERASALLDRLRAGPERLRRAAERASSRGPAVARDVWTPAEHLAHVLEAEREVFHPRVTRLQEAARDEVPTFADWPPRDPPGGADRGRDVLLAEFAEARRRTVSLLDGLEPGDWHRTGIVDDEQVRLHQLMRGAAQHDEAHAARITERIHPDLLEVT